MCNGSAVKGGLKGYIGMCFSWELVEDTEGRGFGGVGGFDRV